MRQIKLFIVIVIALLLSGCWDKIEMENKALVLALGIDFDGDYYNFTYAVGNNSKPEESEDTPTPSEGSDLIKIKAMALENANARYMKETPRQPNFEHLKIIVIGEALYNNQEKLEEILLEIEQNYEIARTVFVFTTDGDANPIMGLEKNIDGPIGLYIRKIIENNAKVISIKTVKLDVLLSSIGEEGTSSVELPKILFADDKPILQ
ncbi:MAG: putative spore germination protein [Clostridiales bacterium]|nr:putative spore germination protein [Clostridiales bacterium]